MARIRSIKPGFFASEDVSALPLRARLTWIGLWTHCDDHGRAKDNVKLIKAAVWPLDSVSLGEIEEDLATLAEHGRIVRYEVDGKRYLEVTNWHDHQKPNKPTPSRLPAPPLNGTHPPHGGHGTFPDGSVRPPVGLPDDSRRTPDGRGEEGRGVGGDQSARVREALDFLVHTYGLTDHEASEVWEKARGRAAGGVVEYPIPYLEVMQAKGHLANLVEEVQLAKRDGERQQPPEPVLYAVPDELPRPAPEPTGPPPMPRDAARAMAHLNTCLKPRCTRCAEFSDRWPDLRKSGT